MCDVIVFFHLSNRTHSWCSKNERSYFFQTYLEPSWIQAYCTPKSHSFPEIQSCQCGPTHTTANTNTHVFLLKGAPPQLYLGVRGGRVDMQGARGCQLILHSSTANAYICCSRIITELSEPFPGPQLPTAYEKTPIKQLSLKVGPNSVI